VDRLSRSLLDFARLIDRFDQRSVSFVSVTQQFNTTSSLGRLTLNILLSFAHYAESAIMQSHSAEGGGVACISVMWDSALSRLEQGSDRRVEIWIGFCHRFKQPSISSFFGGPSSSARGIAFSS
jgi:hypothetical protein